MANVTPPSNKAAAKPIRAEVVMIFSMPIPRTSGRTPNSHRLFPDSPITTNSSHVAAIPLRERTRPGVGTIEPCLTSPAKAPHDLRRVGYLEVALVGMEMRE